MSAALYFVIGLISFVFALLSFSGLQKDNNK